MNTHQPTAQRSYVVIPARRASTRLPNKMLLDDTGRTLIEHTYASASRARVAAGVIVATDDERIAEVVRSAGGQAAMTSPACQSGTDRVAEVAAGLPDADILVNVQGDEPELDPRCIDQVIELLARDPSVPMATLATPIRSAAQLSDPACVKVVFGECGRAMYFSRNAIPHVRDGEAEQLLAAEPAVFYQHLGIYAYRRDFLLELARQAPAPIENLEMLEQLRVLSMGHAIQVGVTDHAASGIDTPDDYAAFVARYQASQRHAA